MTSEIRANTLKNRVGLGTVSFTNTGIVVSGIVTANSFSGSISGTTGTFSGDITIPDKIIHAGDTNTAIRFPAADTFSVETAGNERLRITSGGDVLIADTTNSVYNDSSGGGMNLKASGQIVTKKQASSTSDPLVWLNDTGQTTNKFIVFAQDGTEKASIGLAGNDLRFARDGYNETLRIETNGNVKATTGTQYKGFNVCKADGGIVAELVGFASDNDEGGLSLWDGGNKKTQIVSNGYSWFMGGNVGINTTTPTQRLVSYADSGYPFVANGPSNSIALNNAGVIVFGTKDVAAYATGSFDANDYTFKTNASVRASITSGGHVNIGGSYTQTSKRLYVDGSVEFTSNLTCVNNVSISGVAPQIIFTDTNQDADFTIKNDGGQLNFIDRTNSNTTRMYANAGGFGGDRLYISNDIVHTGDTDTKIEFDTDTINFDTAGSERLRIFSDGKFGFGTGNSLSEQTMAEFSSSVGGGAIGANITIRNSSTNSVNNVAELRLKTAHGVARFYKYNTGSTVIQSHTSGASDLLLYADGASSLRLHTNGLDRLNIDSAGRVTLGAGTQSQFASSFNSGANQLLITSNGSTGLTIDATSSTSGSIHFADGSTGSESYRGIIEYKHSEDDMRFAVEATHVARLRKGSYSDSGGGMIIGNNDDNSGDAHSDSRTLILGATGRSETGMTLITSTSGTGKIRFSDGVQYYNQGAIGYYHNNRTVAQIPTYGESLSFVAAQKENNFVLNGNEAIRVCSDMDRQKMVDGFWHKDLTTSFQTVFSIQSGYDNSSIHRAYFYEIIVYGGDWGSHSANRTYFKGFINGADTYQGHTVIEHSGTYGSNTGGQGHYGSSQCQIQVTFTGNGNSHIQMKLSTGSYRAEGYARFIGFIRDYDGFHIR